MKNFKRIAAVAATVALGATTMGLAACGGNEGSTPEQTPFIKEVVILNAPETYYLEGETFDEGDFALQEIYSDGTKKNVTSGYEFIRKQKSVLVDPDNYTYEDQDVPLNDPLTNNDNEIYISYKTTCQGYNLEYNLTQPITVKDPTATDTEIFTVGDNDKIYFYGDGTVQSYGIQYAGYWQMFTNSGKWSWDGETITIAMENWNPNVCENGNAKKDGSYRELKITKSADGACTFHFEWAASMETVGEGYKTYTYGGTIPASVFAKRLTADKKYGEQDLAGKYSKQIDNL